MTGDRSPGRNRPESTPVRRRWLLRSAVGGSATALTGCVGVLGGGGGATRCADLAAEYETFEAGSRPMVVDFEYSHVFEETIYSDSTGTAVFQGVGPKVAVEGKSERRTLEFHAEQPLQPLEANDPPSRGTEVVAEVDVRGETARFWRTTQHGAPNFGELVGQVPYRRDGSVEWYSFRVSHELAVYTESVPEACRATIDEITEHVVTSVTPNRDTTIDEVTPTTSN